MHFRLNLRKRYHYAHHSIIHTTTSRKTIQHAIPFRIDAHNESVRSGNREALIQHLFDLHSNPTQLRVTREGKEDETYETRESALNRKPKF